MPLSIPEDRVLHGWGQFSGQWNEDAPGTEGDLAELEIYEQEVAPHLPAMISFYVLPTESNVTGFLEKYNRFMVSCPFFVLQLALYFQEANTHKQVALGEKDAVLNRLLKGLIKAGLPVLLRIGYEFNNQYSPYDPKHYVQAFRRISSLIKELKATNIATVWHAEPGGLQSWDYRNWNPGQDVVDWWGLSLFFQEHGNHPKTLEFLADAKKQGKPVLLAESSLWFKGRILGRLRGPDGLDEASLWYKNYFEFMNQHSEIKAMSSLVLDWSRWNLFFPEIQGGLPNVRFELWPGLGKKYKALVGGKRFIHREEAKKLFGYDEPLLQRRP